MKENKFRILFILIVLVIIGFAIFKIYGRNTQKISENELVVVESLPLKEIKTKEMARILNNLKVVQNVSYHKHQNILFLIQQQQNICYLFSIQYL